jgi:hypothetical protein
MSRAARKLGFAGTVVWLGGVCNSGGGGYTSLEHLDKFSICPNVATGRSS